MVDFPILVELDGERVKSRGGLHKYLRKVLRFPSYYGNNLDALYDCLTDLHEDLTLAVAHPDALRQSLGSYADRLLLVLDRASTDNPHLTISID